MDIEYTVQILQEGDQFIAHAIPLDVMSSGATPQAAREALYEAVELFITIASDMGTLNDVLIETGYRYQRGEWRSPTWIGDEPPRAEV